ncbi:MAG: heavy-metal-associated domain-containing protein [Gammaproteobacteria bacterium]|nr:heavy-metal-associated domain-containing protein [Gammaproteobacteria bacterium]
MKKITLVLISLLWLSITAWAAEQVVVDIGVTGLACPFCVYSVEKNLGKLPEVDSVEVNLVANSARIVIKDGHEVDLEQIKQAIVKAGFTPGDATISMVQE